MDFYSRNEAEHYLWFQDPLTIHVAEDDLYLTYSYNGACATGSYPGHAPIPFAGSGWFLLSSLAGQAPTHPYQSYCDSYNGYGQSSFANTVFCPAVSGTGVENSTFISFYNEIDGLSSGGATYRFTYSATGGCTFLLFFENYSNLNLSSP